jgi:sulfite exporter TauE/SafE
MGLLGGVHCLGMCGGVVAMLTAGLDPQVRSNPSKVALFHLNYNLGRILSYILMGVVFGLLGAVLAQTLQMSSFDKALRIFSSASGEPAFTNRPTHQFSHLHSMWLNLLV